MIRKFNIGDKVDFLNDVGGGVVKQLLDNNMVIIETEDGFEYPVQERDLIKSAIQNQNNFQTQENINSTKNINDIFTDNLQIVTKDNEEVNIYLSILKQNKLFNLNLINDSNWYIMYLIQTKENNKYSSIPGMLQPNYIEKIFQFNTTQIALVSEIVCQLMFFRKIPYDTKEPIVKTITINPTRYFSDDSYTNNEFFDEKAFMIPIIEENPMAEAVNKLKNMDLDEVIYKKETESQKTNSKPESKKKVKQDTIEIDLHINELLENTIGMEAADMLEYQMDTFKKELDKAFKNKIVKKIVFIHGKGNGTLKTEIRKYLDKNSIRYQDASFQKYGFGATLVFLRKK